MLHTLEKIFLKWRFALGVVVAINLVFFIIIWTEHSDAYNNIPNTPSMNIKNIHTNIKYWKYNQLVTAYATQIKEMQKRGY